MREIFSDVLVDIFWFLLTGLILMALWNEFISQIFNVQQISYLQSLGLMLISNFLFKSNVEIYGEAEENDQV